MWVIRNFYTDRELAAYLNGEVVGTVNIHDGADVDLLTLIINNGGGDVTVNFAPAKGRPWTAAEIVGAINAAPGLADTASLKVPERYDTSHPPGQGTKHQYLCLFNDPAITVRNTGTANTLLGFNAAPAPHQPQVLIAMAAIGSIQYTTQPNPHWTTVINV
jgi:hypothetical protein